MFYLQLHVNVFFAKNAFFIHEKSGENKTCYDIII